MATGGRGNPGWWIPLDPRAERAERRNMVREEQERQMLRDQGVDISEMQVIGNGENADTRGQYNEADDFQDGDHRFEDADGLELRLSDSGESFEEEDESEGQRSSHSLDQAGIKASGISLEKQLEERTLRLREERDKIDELFSDIERRQALTEQRGAYLAQRREDFERHLHEKEAQMRKDMQEKLKAELYSQSMSLLQKMEEETVAKKKLAEDRQKEIAQREYEITQAEDRWNEEKKQMEQASIERLKAEYEQEQKKRQVASGARPKEIKQERIDLKEIKEDRTLTRTNKNTASKTEDRQSDWHERYSEQIPHRDRNRHMTFASENQNQVYGEPRNRTVDRSTDKLSHTVNDREITDRATVRERQVDKRQQRLQKQGSVNIDQYNEYSRGIVNSPGSSYNRNSLGADTERFGMHGYTLADEGLTKASIGIFSGAEPRPKNEGSFEDWKLEAESLIAAHRYSDLAITQAMRKSLRVPAKKVLLPLGPTATPMEILNRLQSVFGYVASCDAIIEEFYTSEQMPDESVADWGIRLEDILQKAIDKGHKIETSKNDTLRRKFWRSLYSQELKNATKIHFETIKDFDELQIKVRIEEHEINARETKRSLETKKKTGKTAVQHQPVFKENDEQMTMLKSMMEQMKIMNKEMQELKARETQPQHYESNYRGRGRQRGGQQQDDTYYRGRGRGRGSGRGKNWQQYDDRQTSEETETEETAKKETVEKKGKDQLNQ